MIERFANISVINRRGEDIYTVDEVSSQVGVPRPTLYRYLREYSIPHIRQAGRIAIPEDSVELIKEARILHEEGMSIESVRRRLREGEVDFQALMERLEEISGSIEALREGIPGAKRGEPGSSRKVEVLSERMDSLISAVFTLTEISERLLSDMQELRASSTGNTSRNVNPLSTNGETAARLELLENEVFSTKERIDSLSSSMESLVEMTTYVVNATSVIKNSANHRRNSVL